MAAKIFVITVYPKKLRLSEVRLGKRPRLTDFGEIGWREETLTDIAQKLKRDLSMSRVRMLLADSLAFVISLEVPQDTPDLREAVAQALRKKKPEVVFDNDWDFRISGEREGYFKALVFAPEKTVWEKLKRAFGEAKITIEAVEPEILAKERDGVAEIGLALKTDLSGWDQQTLNVVPREGDEKILQEHDLSKKKAEKQGSGFPWVWAFLAILTLLGVVIGGVVVSQRALRARPTPTPTPVGGVAPVATEASGLEFVEASPSATPKAPIELGEYSVQVLNGSGLAGAASKVGLLLEKVGFEEIAVGNAGAATHELTQVQRKEAVADEVVEAMIDALSESYEVAEAEGFLDEVGTYEVVVIVGREKR